MSLVLPMCILISCSSVLCVLMALGMFVKVMSSLISVMSPLLVCTFVCDAVYVDLKYDDVCPLVDCCL